MKIHESAASRAAATLHPDELRQQFLLRGLFAPGELRLHWWEVDRTVVGAAIPLSQPIALTNPAELRAACFLERRELGVINLGGGGTVEADGVVYELAPHDALYLGRGVKQVSFASRDAAQPARFWLQSYPAHASHPTRHIPFREDAGMRLGTKENANERTLFKLLHPGTLETCQLVMGFTRLEPGSVWNSMPPHTHRRRSEVYLYFNVPTGQAVFHFMGEPQATRHLVVRDLEAVLSPPWSIHCGSGTAAYSFVWGMGGENQEFTDMDPAPVDQLQ